MRLSSPFRLDPRIAGGVLCVVGLALLTPASLLSAALGVEFVAAAFWCWARAAEGASEQVPRWAWLRRPATGLWLAAAIHATLPGYSHAMLFPATGAREALRWAEAIAVLWAGLELMAALPLARPYSDLPGPLLATRPWLPVMLPAAGFVVLWRQSPHWIGVTQVRDAAVPLLLLTGVLGALRAFARRQWTASLRWLAVSDSALAALIVAYGTVSAEAALLLWLGASSGHAFLLAGELHGALPRRGPTSTRLWRAASWTALVSLAWPALIGAGSARSGRLHLLYFLAAALTAAMMAWITVGRMTAAPERRRIMRPDPVLTLSQFGAVAVLALGPAALVLAWWTGFEPSGRESLLALAPAALGGISALIAHRQHARPVWEFLHRMGESAPAVAGRAFRLVVDIERWLVGLAVRLLRGVTSPLHDLHTGDAQEYLLFLMGLGVLALVLPLLR